MGMSYAVCPRLRASMPVAPSVRQLGSCYFYQALGVLADINYIGPALREG